MNRGMSRVSAFVLIAFVMLSGCAGSEEVKTEPVKAEVNHDKSITVSNNVSPDEGNVLICIAGYEKNGSKIALIQDIKGAAGFDVIDVNTDKSVLSGRVKYKKDSSSNDGILGICDFSEVDKTGSFYIRIDTGRVSNVFRIEADIYRKLLADRLSSLGEEDSETGITEENIGEHYLRITDYLLAQEFFPDSINPVTDSDARIIPRTMLPAKAEIDHLKELISADGSFSAPLSGDPGRLYQFSAVFALFSYEYADYDRKSADECADLAKKAFSYAEDSYKDSGDSDKKKSDDKRFWASAQLYKLTGNALYRDITESYVFNIPAGWDTDRCGYLGSLAYLTCYQKIDLDVSGQFITELMDGINSVVRDSSKYDQQASEEEYPVNSIFENARLAVLGNYISKNIKYVECAENSLAYLYGRNMLGKDYAYGSDSEFYNEPQMFILAGLIDSYIYEDKKPEAMER